MTQDKKSASTTLFGLLRHGETEWNALGKIQGSADSPLTPNGIFQTKRWIETLRKWQWDRIHASNLGRVQETAAIINEGLGVPITSDNRLQEQNWGEWEGLTIPLIQKVFSEELEKRVARGWEFAAPGGETRAVVRDRVLGALSEIATAHPGKKILILCHQGVIKTVLYHLSKRKFLPGEDPLLQHNNFHLINCKNGEFFIDRLNIAKQSEQ